MVYSQSIDIVPPSLELPGAPLPPGSVLYLERPPLETQAFQYLMQPGALLRLKAPRKMGKSSLLNRIITYAQEQTFATALIDLQAADGEIFTGLSKFLRWLCLNVSLELGLQPRLDDYWDDEVGSKLSCTLYLEQYILSQLDGPLVLIVNEVNRIFEYGDIVNDVLSLLRFWHERAKRVTRFQSLRLVLAYVTDVYVTLDLNQSPFNVGLVLQLPALTLPQVQTLAHRYGLSWPTAEACQQALQHLLELVGGHPYLSQLACYHLAQGLLTWPQLLQEAATPAGIYRDYLQRLLALVRQDLFLAAAFKRVIDADAPVLLDTLAAHKLHGLGLIHLEGNHCRIACQLYQQYFSQQHLVAADAVEIRAQQLAQENQTLQMRCLTDTLTQIGNRSSFEEGLQREWQRLARAEQFLSLLLFDIDYFKQYNDTYGHRAGDTCLQQVARAMTRMIQRPADLVARYGGEEFVVLLPHTDEAGALHLADLIRRTIKDLQIPHVGSQLPSQVVTVSVGVASQIPDYRQDPGLLLQAADEALYQSKALGRDRATAH